MKGKDCINCIFHNAFFWILSSYNERFVYFKNQVFLLSVVWFQDFLKKKMLVWPNGFSSLIEQRFII